MHNTSPATQKISTELRTLYDLDQEDRAGGQARIDFEKMRANDKPRLQRAKEIYKLLKEKSISLSGEELYFLAMLFQHSPVTEDYRTAQEVALLSAKEGYERGRWLSAAAEDRYLLAIDQKQKWGTQFTHETGEWSQFPMQSDEESGVTDEMRKEKGVPVRQEQMKVFLNRVDI